MRCTRRRRYREQGREGEGVGRAAQAAVMSELGHWPASDSRICGGSLLGGIIYDRSVTEIQTAIVELPFEELANLLDWIEEYRSDAWDRQTAQDVEAGRFDALRQRVREQHR
jgi:hypothetical protein